MVNFMSYEFRLYLKKKKAVFSTQSPFSLRIAGRHQASVSGEGKNMAGSLMPGITGLWHKSPLRPCHPANSSGPWSLPDHGFLAFVHHLNLQRHYAHFSKFKQEGKLVINS